MTFFAKSRSLQPARQVNAIIRCEVDEDWFSKEQLHFAARDGDLARAQHLITEGYALNVFDDIDYTPLHYAVKHEHLDMESLLVASGADVNALDIAKDRMRDDGPQIDKLLSRYAPKQA